MVEVHIRFSTPYRFKNNIPKTIRKLPAFTDNFVKRIWLNSAPICRSTLRVFGLFGYPAHCLIAFAILSLTTELRMLRVTLAIRSLHTTEILKIAMIIVKRPRHLPAAKRKPSVLTNGLVKRLCPNSAPICRSTLRVPIRHSRKQLWCVLLDWPQKFCNL